MRRGWPDLPRSEWERLISEWILKDSYRDIMRRYLCDGWTQERIAERFKGSAVKRAKYEGLIRNLKALRGNGDR